MRRFSSFCSALDVLSQADAQDLENEFIQGGIIDKFFIQFELSWKLFKVLLAYEGDPVASTGSPRDILKAAFKYYGFLDEDCWLSMLRDRNSMAHVYDGAASTRLVRTVIDRYIPEFRKVQEGLEARYGDMQFE